MKRPNNSRIAEQESSAMSIFIPEEIIFDILTRLPAKSLSRFRCVSKSWNNLIKNPRFVKLQINHSLKYGEPGIIYTYTRERKICCVDYDSSSSRLSISVAQFDCPSELKMGRIIDSCNGLVCYLSSLREIVICNPYIKDYRKLPSPSEPDVTNPRYEYDNYTYCKYGFGYDSKTDDYKFACMSKYPGMSTEIIVYSLIFDSWKIWQDIPYELADDDLVLFEGIFYWVEDRSEYAETDEDIGKVISSLDSGVDSFTRYALPQHFKKCIGRIYVCVLGGCLHIIGNHHRGSFSEVWVMKDFGWTKLFTIDKTSSGLRCFACLNLKHSFKNGEILVQANSAFSYLYDLKRKRFEKLVFNDCEVFNSCAFLGTFVSPNNLGTSLGNAAGHNKRQKVSHVKKMKD